tara:strand:- start:71 stop:346 length:276 start_codon:yes stop_codon:yes gene_type:complete
MKKVLLPVILASAAVLPTGCNGFRWQFYENENLSKVQKQDSQLDNQYLDLDKFFRESANQKFIGEMFEVCYMQRLFTKKYKSIYECFDSKN